VRFGLDILWMAALLQHLRTQQRRWLVMAALYAGFALYYMTSVGMGVMAAFYFYLFTLLFFKRKTDYLCLALPVFSSALFFGMTFKGYMFQKEYWHNLMDYMVVFGHTGSMPMWESLKYRHFWAFFMSMAMPLTYIVTLLYIGASLYLEKGPLERLW